MEKSKKIISIVLIICALSALCAVGASAAVPDQIYSTGRNDSSSYHIINSSASLPMGFGDQQLYIRQVAFTCSSIYSSSIIFTVQFYLTWAEDRLSDLQSYLSGLTCIYSDFDPFGSLSSFSPCTLVSSQAEFVSTALRANNYNVTCIYTCSSVPSLSSSGYYTFCFPSPDASYGYFYMKALNSLSLEPYTPEPEPEPSSPSSEGGSLLEGFTWAQNIGYYASFSPLLNSSTLEPTYLSTTRFSSMPYDQITDLKFQTPSSSNGCALIEGQRTDYSDIFVDHTVIYGVAAMLLTSPNFKLDQSTLSPDFDATIFLASGDDPSASGYTQVDASTVGFDSYTFRVWTLDYNEWSRIVMVRFYFLFEEGVGTATYPTDTISVQFKSTALHTHEWYCTPFDFRLQYALRDSSSSPLPDSVANYNPATGSPTSNGGYNTSGATVADNMNQELDWGNKTLEQVSPFNDILEMVTTSISPDPFTHFIRSMESLYNGISYSGSGGALYLPEASIPWGSSTLKLWDRQEIPFTSYINQIPSQYCIIISFLLLAGGGFACFAILASFFRRVWFGDIRSERF